LATDWDAERIARISLETAAEICIYTNKSITLEMIGS
jgi:ATP-dependent protease HslVU (ClpYQ) peptidase subunit